MRSACFRKPRAVGDFPMAFHMCNRACAWLSKACDEDAKSPNSSSGSFEPLHGLRSMRRRERLASPAAGFHGVTFCCLGQSDGGRLRFRTGERRPPACAQRAKKGSGPFPEQTAPCAHAQIRLLAGQDPLKTDSPSEGECGARGQAIGNDADENEQPIHCFCLLVEMTAPQETNRYAPER